MKPTTFLDYIVAEHTSLLDGWYSGAAFEGAVQVIFDRIFRRHLSNKVAFLEPQPENGVHFEPVALAQQSGRFATPIPQGLIVRPIAQDAWPTQREIKYDGLTTIADFRVANKRAVNEGSEEQLSIKLKQTYYWIEIKVESPSTNNFGGKSLQKAFDEDATKLNLQKQNDLQNLGGRKRYWFVMVAFSDPQCAAMKVLGNAGWTEIRDAQVQRGTFTICLKEM